MLDKSFIDYVMSFYGEGEIYDYGFTPDEIVEGYALRMERFPGIPFCGDTTDREIVRDCVLALRGETNLEYKLD